MKTPKPRKLAGGQWFIQLRLNGVSIPVSAATEKECTRQAALVKAEYQAGKREMQKCQGDRTIKEIIEGYIKSRQAVLSPSTIRSYNAVKNNRFTIYSGKKPADIKDWQDVINAEVRSGASAKTVKNSWALLVASLSFAGLKVPTVTLPKIAASPRPWLDPEQIRVFIDAVKGQKCEIPALLALHSLRRSEILGLTWDKIDLKARIIRVEGSAVFDADCKLIYKATNKSKKSRRTVPIMIPELAEVLNTVPAENRSGRLIVTNPDNIRAQINRVCKAAGLPEVGVHGLRHSFASLAHHVGLPEQEAMMIGGWEDAQTMHNIYTHISNADKLKSENKIAEFFKNANKNANEFSKPA